MTPKVSYQRVTSLIPRHLLQGAEGHVLAASASWKRRRCTTFRRPVSTCDRCARQPVVPQTTSAELYESGECARTNNRAHSAVGWSPIVAMLAGSYRANGTVPPGSAGRRRAGMLGGVSLRRSGRRWPGSGPWSGSRPAGRRGVRRQAEQATSSVSSRSRRSARPGVSCRRLTAWEYLHRHLWCRARDPRPAVAHPAPR
jgi:hypothetical protein